MVLIKINLKGVISLFRVFEYIMTQKYNLQTTVRGQVDEQDKCVDEKDGIGVIHLTVHGNKVNRVLSQRQHCPKQGSEM